MLTNYFLTVFALDYIIFNEEIYRETFHCVLHVLVLNNPQKNLLVIEFKRVVLRLTQNHACSKHSFTVS